MNCNKKTDILYRILRSHFEFLRTFLQSFFLANAAIYIRNLFCKDLQRSEILCRLQNRSSDRIKSLVVEHDSISYVQLALAKLSLFFAWYSFKPRVLLSLDNFVCAKRALFFGNKSVQFALMWGSLPQMKCILTQDLVCRINVNVLKAMVGNLWGRGIKWSIDAACFFPHIETFPLYICW